MLRKSLLAAASLSLVGCAALAFMNGGGVRSPGFTFASSPAGEGNGNVTCGEAFTVQPFGNSLVTLSLTTQNIKDFLEEQFAGCLGQSPTATRFALPSAGFKYSWDGAKACGARISNVTLRSGGSTETLANELSLAVGNAFPGSAVFAVEYVGASNAEAAWPVLRTGFLGSASGDSGERLLGIDMPAGTRGGPVFDAAGQLIGLALPGRTGKGGDRLLAASQLREALGPALTREQQPAARDSPQPSGATPREPVDKIYEASLRSALQVITAP